MLLAVSHKRGIIMYKANIYVTLKSGVLDPQGDAVRRSLGVMGFEGVSDLRIGKFIELSLDSTDAESARTELREMSDKLLANPVIEDYRVELVEG